MLHTSNAPWNPNFAYHLASERNQPKLIDQVFIEGDHAYADLLDRIVHATQRVWIESYIFDSDEVGWQLAQALAAKAAQGVDVRIMVDAFGSRNAGMLTLAQFLESSGARWKWFHPWSWHRIFRYNIRNHCKLWLIDDDAAYLGGFNIHRKSSRRWFGFQRWRDTQVRVRSTLVPALARSFEARWDGRKQAFSAHTVAGGQVLLSGPNRRCHRQLRCATKSWLDSAQRRLWIATPYLVPDRGIRRQLRRAAGRGVDVRLLVPERSDVAIVDWAARFAAREMARVGVRIQFYRPRFLHAKTMLKDNDSVWVGSANLDYRSLWKNFELNLVAVDPVANTQFSDHFQNDWQQSIVHAPATGWFERFRQRLAWMLRRWL